MLWLSYCYVCYIRSMVLRYFVWRGMWMLRLRLSTTPIRTALPMAESDFQHQPPDLLRPRGSGCYFRGRPDVYVSGNLFLYYREGPQAVVAPNVFVSVRGGEARPPFLLKLWGRPSPDFVLEITSKSTRADQESKPQTYARLGVREYVQYDPTETTSDPRRPSRGRNL